MIDIAEIKKGYKATELGILPDEWNILEISDFSKVITGSTPSTKKEEYWNGKIPFITPIDLVGSTIRKTDRTITEEGLKISRPLPLGTILVSCIGYIGKIGIVDT